MNLSTSAADISNRRGFRTFIQLVLFVSIAHFKIQNREILYKFKQLGWLPARAEITCDHFKSAVDQCRVNKRLDGIHTVNKLSREARMSRAAVT